MSALNAMWSMVLRPRHSSAEVTAASESAGIMVVLFGVAIIISAVVGEKISRRYAKEDDHAAPEVRGAAASQAGSRTEPT